MAGRPLPLAVLMMIPEAWSGHESMSEERKAFYEYHGCLMEPWDGPASIAFTDGTVIGAVLDRNGLRPSRYYVTKDGLVVMASEVGVLDIPPERRAAQGAAASGPDLPRRHGPGPDHRRRGAEARLRRASIPYGEWLKTYLPANRKPPRAASCAGAGSRDGAPAPAGLRLHARGPAHSAGADGHRRARSPSARWAPTRRWPSSRTGRGCSTTTSSSCSPRSPIPPLDGIREELVTQIATTIGPEGNLLEPTPEACRQIKLKTPILDNEELARIRHMDLPAFKATTVSMLFPVAEGPAGLARAMEELCRQASRAVADGYTYPHPVRSRRRSARQRAHPSSAGHLRRSSSPDPRGQPRQGRA